MRDQRIKTKYEGVYYRERKALFNGRPDRSYDFCRTVDGRKLWTFAGRASLGATPESARDSRLKAMAEDRTRLCDRPFGAAVELLEADARIRHSGQSLSICLDQIRIWLAPLSREPMSGLTKARVAEIAQGWGDRLARSTVDKLAMLLRRAFDLAMEAGLHPGPNPTAKLRLKGEHVKCERFLTEAEADLLLEILGRRSPPWRDMAELSLLTGLRMMEIKRLRGSDVSLETRTLRVLGKSGKREAVLLLPRAAEILAARLDRPGPLFPRAPHYQFYAALAESGLNAGVSDVRHKVRFHTFRHTFASWLVQRGAGMHAIQRLMRHASPAMTQRYAHLRPEDLQTALELLIR